MPAHIYCCGPRALMDGVRDMSGHWAMGSVHFESFGVDAALRRLDRPFDVRLARSGTVLTVPAEPVDPGGGARARLHACAVRARPAAAGPAAPACSAAKPSIATSCSASTSARARSWSACRARAAPSWCSTCDRARAAHRRGRSRPRLHADAAHASPRRARAAGGGRRSGRRRRARSSNATSAAAPTTAWPRSAPIRTWRSSTSPRRTSCTRSTRCSPSRTASTCWSRSRWPSTLADCTRMIDAAAAARRHLIVGHSHSFDGPVLRVRELIDSGEFGAVRMIHAFYATDYLYRPRRPEELRTAEGGGVIYSQAVHQLDIVRLLGGGLVRSIRAQTGAWDPQRPTEGAYSALLTFANGAFASATYSGYAHYDGDELADNISEVGLPRSEADYGAARRRLAAAAPGTAEAALKAARNYGGSAYVPAGGRRRARAPALRPRARLLRSRRLAAHAARRGDLRRRRAPLRAAARAGRAARRGHRRTVVGRRRWPTAPARWPLGPRDARSVHGHARFRARRPRRRAAVSDRAREPMTMTSESAARTRASPPSSPALAEDAQEILRHWREAVPHDRLAHLVKDATRAFVRALQARLARTRHRVRALGVPAHPVGRGWHHAEGAVGAGRRDGAHDVQRGRGAGETGLRRAPAPPRQSQERLRAPDAQRTRAQAQARAARGGGQRDRRARRRGARHRHRARSAARHHRQPGAGRAARGSPPAPRRGPRAA